MSDVEAFLAELDAQNARALERIGAAAALEPAGDVTVPRLLALALKNELEATECAAMWIPTTREVDVKLALARQAGDEAKHFRLIEKRLGELGVATDAARFGPGPPSPLLQWLATLETTVERVAAGLYRDVIQPDERHHHELGRTLLARLATTEGAREQARAAARKTLELAEELQEIARLKMGVSRAPGC